MNVASLELCKELYELSGWNDCMWHYPKTPNHIMDGLTWRPNAGDTPGYDLGYLLRKLPPVLNDVFFLSLFPRYENDMPYDENFVIVWHSNYEAYFEHDNIADTPENVACLLATQLFHQGILKKGDVGHE